jgi:hypothetical protein
VIYFHWLITLLGAGVKWLHLDPGVLFAVTGVVASVVCSALTLRLVELVLPDAHGRRGWFLLTMWGGGIVALVAAALNLAHGRPLTEELFRLDAGEGWWFSNWGRNLILPTEAVYHCLVAAAWIGVLQRRWVLAIGGVTALAATHPFSGLQHLLILGVWCSALAVRERSPAAWARAGVVLAVGAAFGIYYFWFLNQFPAHRALTAVWSTAHEVTGVSLLLSIGPLAAICLWRLHLEHWRPDEAGWFWITAFAVTFLLMKHDWFIPAHQPAHFSRGYHWLPLWLLALPQLQRWGRQVTAAFPPFAAATVLGAFGVLAVADNVAFLGHDLDGGERDRIHLTAGQREMFAWMDAANLRGVLLCFDTRVSYHSAVYTGVRPYLGHLNNTPDIRTRWRDVAAWHRRGETGPWFQTIDYILIDRSDPPAAFDQTRWAELHRNAEYILLGRPARDSSS